MPSFNTRRHVHAILTPMLKLMGFKKRERGIYTLDLGGDFFGWLGLPDAVRDGEIAINPFVGVRHQGVHALLGKLTGRPPHAYLSPSIVTPLGFLLPDRKWREWYFDDADKVEEFEKFVQTIDSAAVPFMRRSANLAALAKALRDPSCVKSNFDLYERLPIVQYLRGDLEGAVSLLDEFAAELVGVDNSRANDFKLKLSPAVVDLCKSGTNTV